MTLAPADVSGATAALTQAFGDAGLSEVLDTSTLTRALYTSDASLYRVVPQAVARPRTTTELAAAVTAAREAGVAITSRGSGTSCAGNSVGPGLVIDTRKLNAILDIDPDRRTALVEPGVVQAQLTKAAGAYGLLFGPDPSTFNRCTIGGMIGNNACGPRAMGYGKTADNVVGMELLTGTGELIKVGAAGSPLAGQAPGPTVQQLLALTGDNLAEIRTGFGRFDRQVSGYSLEHLLPENGGAVHRFLAGTEGTLGTMVQAEVRLVEAKPYQTMIVIGYPSMADAGDAAATVARHRPVAVEGLDRRIVDKALQSKGTSGVPDLPRGDGWLFVELADDDADRLADRARAVAEDVRADATDLFLIEDPAARAALWRIRADGAGLASVGLAKPAHAGWEDAAVPVESLGDYLREFEALLGRHRLHGLPYGHFGDGCIHIRIDFDLDRPSGVEDYRRFITEAAHLVASYGGSMSGEHGDGRARSRLLPIMYSEAQLRLFGQVKSIFDPAGLFNPGVLVDPEPITANLRIPQSIAAPLRRQYGHLTDQVHQCTGVGKCVADNSGTLAVMCPSYQATGDEKDSTRGRARVLQEMINGQLITDGFRSAEVHEALDLCLSCKGCARDCPTGIDMAAYKATVLDETYRGRIRPRSHYVLGWLPRWGRLITRFAPVARLTNLGMRLPGIRSMIKWTAGVDQRRSLPAFATTSAERRGVGGRRRAQLSAGTATATEHRPVAIWVDSFTAAFSESGALALAEVLRSAGYSPELLINDACCGLTWISTGQLDGARRQLRHALDVLHPVAADGIPIIGVEPSCLAVWRSDAGELLDDPRVTEVAGAVTTLAELLARTPDWSPPDLTGTTIVVQPHCHHASVIGWEADADLLSATGAAITTVGGCCGLAGNFGVERGHHEVSVKVAETELLPAVRKAGPEAVVLADGFSCRTQLAELADVRAISLPELLLGHR
ncbi:FAD-binding and (Fe-S)-binding domain-containing protein [Propionibacteriaceae bacterium Y2011]|uniref:FAD-binding and (Fe-S)-binding domain-containing protein n=1 Tax=Microlunatus sp. Y2014 TaxID=3418488 RepID=UPI003B48A376